MKTTYNFDHNDMRTRFHALRAERERMSTTDVEPLRKQMDDIIAEIRVLEAKLKPIDATYREKRQALVPMDTELAIISRALKGQTGASE
ncbi:hypothetical protein X747_14780 [Mesorhizobium sp. LNJC384A00]|uniref:hypothetical protein n=1 Tax=unclassified Mesorhizobium TaxID=325217 RepID=UPI0003CF61CA|nr:hypothetical protein [Mesorhizobium sp. LNJC384A00]ESY42042.1 hypothetical protein X747_14780 [Mesorhizobium sp. LNJC384A00]